MTKPRRTDIQALRGLAVLLVLFYHAEVVGLRAGYLGVDIFFVISGYLMASLIAREIRERSFSFASFYLRRAKRLLPSAYIVFLATFLLSLFLLTRVEYESFCQQVVGSVTFTANLVLWQQSGYFSEAASLKPLLHTWSLSLEEQYYLLLPLTLVVLPRRFWRLGLGCALLASLALCLWLRLRSSPSAAFYLLPTRAWELLLGSLGAVWAGARPMALPRWLSWPAALTLLVLPAVSLPGDRHPGASAVMVCVATLITILARLPLLNGSRPATWLARVGDISYSVYLVHWPLFALANNAYAGAEPPLAVRFALLLASIGLGQLLYRLVEAPLRYASLPVSLKSAGVVLVPSLALLLIPVGAQALTTTEKDYASVRRINQGFGADCEFTDAFTEKPGCRTSDHPELLIWGDSYAMHLVPGIAQNTDRGVIQATSSGCGPFVDLAPLSRKAVPRQARDCLSFNASVLRYLRTQPEIEIVVLSSPFEQYVGPDAFGIQVEDGRQVEKRLNVAIAVRAMRATVAQLRSLGKRVILISPPPRAAFNIGLCLERLDSRKLIVGPHLDCALPLHDFRAQQAPVRQFLERVPEDADVPVIRLDDFLCEATRCRTMMDGVFLYRDSGHLSHEGSVYLATRAELVPRIRAEAR